MKWKRVKFVLRVVLALLLVLPSYPILLAGCTLMGMSVVVGVFSLCAVPFAWLIGDSSGKDQCIEFGVIGLLSIFHPFLFWWDFVIGKNPLEEF